MQLGVLNRLYQSTLQFSKEDTMQQMAEPCVLSESQLEFVQGIFDHLSDFFRLPVTLGDIGSHATLANLLERCELGERYGEKR